MADLSVGFQARSEGRCAVCGFPFDEGDWIMYGDTDELIHDWCENS
jgi:hypothetical protein